MELYRALEVSAGDVVAFAGAGGKSSAIIRMASELTAAGMRVLVAPTTKMTVEEANRTGQVVTSEDPKTLLQATRKALDSSPAVVAGRGILSNRRVAGVAPDEVEPLSRLTDVTLVEADGSRRRPLKGTAPHEPAFPACSTLAVAVGSISAYGMPADADHVHRPEPFADQTGIARGGSITASAFARALARGSLANPPQAARTAALITSVEPGRTMSEAAAVARELWRLGLKKVVFCSLPPDDPPRVWIP